MSKIVDLSVANTQKLNRNNEPVSTGVPLPRELQIEDAQKLKLLDENGDQVPAQFQPLAWWTDQKTVKWLLVHFQADLPQQSSTKYTLQYDSESEVNIATPVARVEKDRVLIDTGKLQCSIENVTGIFTEFKVKTERLWWNCSRGSSSGPEMILTTSDNKKWVLGCPTELIVEDNGSERAVLKLSGNYESKEKKGHRHPSFTYELRDRKSVV